MEVPIIKHTKDPHFFSDCHPSSFLLRHGFPHLQFQDSDIEMITIPAVKYTSLRDIMPVNPPAAAAAIMSPVNNSSWHEIPIKNPLVKQAALAYLHPMSTPQDVANKGLLDVLREKCFCGSRGEMGCFQWLSGVFFNSVAEFLFRFSGKRGIDDCEEDEEEEEEGVD